MDGRSDETGWRPLWLALLLLFLWLSPAIHAAGDFEFDEGTGTITRYVGNDTEPVIPALIDGVPVVAIGEEVFRYGATAGINFQLVSVALPEGLQRIGKNAFNNSGLSSVDLPSTLLEIEEGGFANNPLTSIELPEGLTTLGHAAFWDCALTTVSLPSTLHSMGSAAFGLNSLTSVTLPAGIGELADNVFWQNQLTSVTLPEGITGIGAYAFAGNALQSVVVPASVHSIGDYAFYANALTEVMFSEGLAAIGEGAFRDNQVVEVSFPDSLVSVGDYAFATDPLANPLTRVRVGAGVSFGLEVTSPNYHFKYYYEYYGSLRGTYVYIQIDGTWYWYPLVHTVAFDSGGGSPVANASAWHGYGVAEPAAPTRSGHGFTGWYRDPARTQPWSFATDLVEEPTTLYAGWSLNQYMVGASVTGAGQVEPASVAVGHGSQVQFVLEPSLGYQRLNSVGGDCPGGSWSGDTWTSGPIEGACTADFTFGRIISPPVADGQPGAGMTVEVVADLGGGADWVFNEAATRGFIPLAGATWVDFDANGLEVPGSEEPIPAPPAGYGYPYPLYDFTLHLGASGTAAEVRIAYPEPLPAGVVYWKYGHASADDRAQNVRRWYQLDPARYVISGDRLQITLLLTDGEHGDDDWSANGVIRDPGMPGVPAGNVAAIPSLGHGALALLVLLMAVAGGRIVRERP